MLKSITVFLLAKYGQVLAQGLSAAATSRSQLELPPSGTVMSVPLSQGTWPWLVIWIMGGEGGWVELPLFGVPQWRSLVKIQHEKSHEFP